jgi:hypothetical protein
MLELQKSEPGINFSSSVKRISASKKEMTVYVKRSLRDVSQLKDAFNQAWSPPKLQANFFPSPSASPPPPPPPSHGCNPTLLVKGRAPKYTSEAHFKILPRLKGKAPTDVLVKKWIK